MGAYRNAFEWARGYGNDWLCPCGPDGIYATQAWYDLDTIVNNPKRSRVQPPELAWVGEICGYAILNGHHRFASYMLSVRLDPVRFFLRDSLDTIEELCGKYPIFINDVIPFDDYLGWIRADLGG